MNGPKKKKKESCGDPLKNTEIQPRYHSCKMVSQWTFFGSKLKLTPKKTEAISVPSSAPKLRNITASLGGECKLSQVLFGPLNENQNVLHFLSTLYTLGKFTEIYLSSPSVQRRHWHITPVLLPRKPHGRKSLVGCIPWGRYESDATERLHFTFHFHTMEKEMATHSSVLAWRIPGSAKPSGLPSMGSHRVGHDWSDLAAAAAAVPL